MCCKGFIAGFLNSFEELLKALDALNSKLNKEQILVELTIVGSMAIYLNDFEKVLNEN